MEECANLLNPQEGRALIQGITSSIEVNTLDEFRAWISTDINRLFPHESLACGIGKINEAGAEIYHLVVINFPEGYIEDASSAGQIRSPVMLRWSKEGTPQLFCRSNIGDGYDKEWLANVDKYGFRNIAAHGIRNPEGNVSTYFSFFNVPGTPNAHHVYLLHLIVPHMHVALTRALRQAPGDVGRYIRWNFGLTKRETQILEWLQKGKTNWEIGRILGLSHNTVKNHVQNIIAKLGANNRTQAVTKAITMRVLYLE